jgi:hypothetical protein
VPLLPCSPRLLSLPSPCLSVWRWEMEGPRQRSCLRKTEELRQHVHSTASRSSTHGRCLSLSFLSASKRSADACGEFKNLSRSTYLATSG